MKSLQYNFKKAQKGNPFLSTLIQFSIAVRHQNYTSKKIVEWFNRLVDKNDYTSSNKKEVIQYCVQLSDNNQNTPEEG